MHVCDIHGTAAITIGSTILYLVRNDLSLGPNQDARLAQINALKNFYFEAPRLLVPPREPECAFARPPRGLQRSITMSGVPVVPLEVSWTL